MLRSQTAVCFWSGNVEVLALLKYTSFWMISPVLKSHFRFSEKRRVRIWDNLIFGILTTTGRMAASSISWNEKPSARPFNVLFPSSLNLFFYASIAQIVKGTQMKPGSKKETPPTTATFSYLGAVLTRLGKLASVELLFLFQADVKQWQLLQASFDVMRWPVKMKSICVMESIHLVLSKACF